MFGVPFWKRNTAIVVFIVMQSGFSRQCLRVNDDTKDGSGLGGAAGVWGGGDEVRCGSVRRYRSVNLEGNNRISLLA